MCTVMLLIFMVLHRQIEILLSNAIYSMITKKLLLSVCSLSILLFAKSKFVAYIFFTNLFLLSFWNTLYFFVFLIVMSAFVKHVWNYKKIKKKKQPTIYNPAYAETSTIFLDHFLWVCLCVYVFSQEVKGLFRILNFEFFT